MSERLPIQELDELADHLAAGRRPPRSAVETFVRVWTRYRKFGVPFDMAVARTGPAATRARNAQLMAAAQLLAWPSAGLWEWAGRLRKAVSNFEAKAWVSIQAGNAPATALEECLARARQAQGKPLPGSRRFYLELLKNESSSFQ
jgi:hypothetical protein